MQATTDDIQEEYDLATSMFGDAVHDIPTRQAWLDKNPEIDFIVKDQGKLVGFINMLPVKHETIMRFMQGEIRGWHIPTEDVLPYTPSSVLECIVMGMATTPAIEKQRRTQYGAKLISGLIDFLTPSRRKTHRYYETLRDQCHTHGYSYSQTCRLPGTRTDRQAYRL